MKAPARHRAITHIAFGSTAAEAGVRAARSSRSRHAARIGHLWQLAALIAALHCFQPAVAQSISGMPYIAVHGKARAEVVPDVFPLEITLEETSQDATKTRDRIEGLAQAILSQAEAAVVADADIQVSNLSVAPEYRFDDKDDKQVFLGNTYSRTFELKFHALPQLGAFIDGLPKAEQLKMETANFQSSRSETIRRELLTQAVADARQTADVMARSVGRRVGSVHNISNQGFNVRYAESGGETELDRIQVTGSRLRAPEIVLREGTIVLDQSVYIIYTLVD